MTAPPPPPTPDNVALSWALCFEIALGLGALLLGRVIGVWPVRFLTWPVGWEEAGLALVAALPALAFMLGMRNVAWQPLVELNELVDERVVPIFRGLSVWELAIISLAAGWGEEVLFRGLLQQGLSLWLGAVLGVALASLAFGLAHCLSPAYFFAAAAIGVYFGLLYWWLENLWVPIGAHAAYDFCMLLYLTGRRVPTGRRDDSNP